MSRRVDMAEILKMEKIVKEFSNIRALDGVDFSVNEGETVAIIGPSGSGKSTLLRSINCLTRISSGKITLNGETFVQDGPDGKAKYLPEKQLSKICSETGMVFQHFNLFPHMTTLGNITYAPIKVKGVSKADAEKRGRELLKLVGLEAKEDNYPGHLSGGQKQRAAIAKVLLSGADVILLDEPTKGLDEGFKEIVGNALQSFAKDGGTVVVTTHDVDFCARTADRCAMLFNGQITGEGAADTFFRGNEFYTTAANRMSRGILDALFAEEIVEKIKAMER